MRITSGGLVGIGTTSPSTRLDIQETSAATYGTISVRGNSRGAGIDMFQNSTFLGQMYADGSSNIIFTNTTSATERMRITSGGSVGIGTTSPSRKLEVYAVDPSFALKSSTTTGYSELYFADSASDSVGFISYAHSTDSMVLGTSGSTRLTIASTGAATFSSTITATSGVLKNSSASPTYLTLDGTNRTSGRNYEIGTGYAGVGNDRFYIYDNTANSSRLVIDASGNVGIGTTSPQRLLDVSNSTSAYIRATCSGSSVFNELYSTSSGGFVGTTSSHNLSFQTAGFTRMALTSGGLLYINTSLQVGTGFVSLVSNLATNTAIAIKSTNSGNSGTFIQFQNTSNVQAGAITHTGATTVAYGTSSDYRLKQDFQDFNGLDLLSKIKMYNYEWKEDKTRAYGVIAHELQPILNYAVVGVKDGADMQSVDYSKIVPVLVKAVQEQQAQIKELKSQLNK